MYKAQFWDFRIFYKIDYNKFTFTVALANLVVEASTYRLQCVLGLGWQTCQDQGSTLIQGKVL